MDDSAYPFAGHPRTFLVAAIPNGDARFGEAGPLVLVVEQRKHCVDKPRLLTRAEAAQLREQLDAALAVFDLAPALAAEERPRPYLGPYPIRGATLADVGFIDEPEVV